MVIPAASPGLRLIDGVIGGVAALLVTALIPRNPRRAETRDGTTLFAGFDSAVGTLTQALRRGDRIRAERGLEKARALQPSVDRWRDSLESGLAIARISPFLRRQHFELERHERIRQSMDLATRNLRVVARRVVYLCDDGVARPVAADVLARAGPRVRAHRPSPSRTSRSQPIAQETLRAVASRLDPASLLPGGGPRRPGPHRRDAPARGRPPRRDRHGHRRSAGVRAADLALDGSARADRRPTAR